MASRRIAADTASARVPRLDSRLRRVSVERWRDLRDPLLRTASFGYGVDDVLGSLDRKRARDAQWRDAALDTLLRMGEKRCLAPGCPLPVNQSQRRRLYCATPIRVTSEAAKKRHDASIGLVGDLLAEVGDFLNIA